MNNVWDNVKENGQMCLKGRQSILDAIPSGGKYLEYGSGGSSLWFLENIAERSDGSKMISVEHHFDWYKKLNDLINDSDYDDFIDYLYRPALYKLELTDSNNKKFVINTYSTPFEENPAGLFDYMHPKEVDFSEIDVILVDGIARASILAYVWHHIKPECKIFLHDINNRNDWYKWGISLYSKTEEVYHNMLMLEK